VAAAAKRAGLTANRVVVLDLEALRAVGDPGHPRHSRMLAVLAARAGRNRRRPGSISVVTTTAVRVEAMLDRRALKSARLNALRVADVPLDATRADRTAALRKQAGGAVADATVAEAALSATGDGTSVTVYTADLSDVPALLAVRALRVRVVRV
jgi:hypothetical protein